MSNPTEVEVHNVEVTLKNIEDIQAAIARECAQMISERSPKRSGTYASGWTFRQDGKGTEAPEAEVYNGGSHASLSHILEKGHIVKNAHGTYGRVAPQPHIKPAAEACFKKYIQQMKKINITVTERNL